MPGTSLIPPTPPRDADGALLAGDAHPLERELRERLRQGDAVLRVLEDSALDGLWYHDLEHPGREWTSPRFWRALGCDPAAMPHTSEAWRALAHPEDLAALDASLTRHLADPSLAYDGIVRFRHADGATRWVRRRGAALRAPDGRPQRMLGTYTDVTTLERAKLALERWADALVHAGWGVAVSDGQRLELVNPEFARMHGRTVDELVGSPVRALFPPTALPELEAAIRRCHEVGRVTWESEHVRPDGSVFPVLVDMTAVRDDAGRVARRIVNVQDLTERKRQEEEARRGALSREVLDSMLEACSVVGHDGRYLYVNDLAVAAFRRPREAILGRTLHELFPHLDGTPLANALARCLRERVHQRVEHERSLDDGSYSVTDLRFIPVAQGACVLALDVSARRSRLSAIVNDSDDAIVGCSLDGRFTSWNRAAERIFGYTAAEAIGQPLALLQAPDLPDLDMARFARILAGERVEHFDSKRRHKDGRVLDIAVTMSPIRDVRGVIEGVSLIKRDVTQVVEMQRQLMQTKQHLEVANRELEAFSYSVAHDLRAPLRSIDGFSLAILEDCAASLDDDGRRYLGLVRESAQLMGQLIDDLLALSRVGRAELVRQPLDLGAIARAIADRLAHLGPARRVTWSFDAGLYAAGDLRLVTTALENLLGNAWKFTSRRDHAHIHVGVRARDDGARAFYVQDDGAGFDPAYAGKLFGVFQRLHATHEFEGTGVGLAIVKRVVERHGGSVHATGAVEAGATFEFTLEPGSPS